MIRVFALSMAISMLGILVTDPIWAAERGGFSSQATGAVQRANTWAMLDGPAKADEPAQVKAVPADPGYAASQDKEDEKEPEKEPESPFIEEKTAITEDASREAIGDAGCGTCGGYGVANGCGCSAGACDTRCSSCCYCNEPYRLLNSRALQCRGIEIGGWVDQGISVVANMPADRYNGVVTFNDRDDEYQMNQFWMFMEKLAYTGGYGWAVGGRIDFVYGTDARFTQASDGLEARWDQTERFYQAALPQFYADLAYNDLTIRAGHFFTILGYEVVQAPQNFFYSHAYTMQYGEPFTHTGMLAIYDMSDRISVTAGFHRGIDQFDDTDGWDTLGFIGAVHLASWNDATAVDFAITSGEQGPDNNTVIYSIVATWNVTDRLVYVIQNDLGQSVGGGVLAQQRMRIAEWFGINQYILYQINPCWAAGARIEWFRDRDGTRVHGLGDGNLNQSRFSGDFYEITLGLNWTPHPNVIVRPEVRWDWFDSDDNHDANPYDAGQRNDQFMLGCDFIISY